LIHTDEVHTETGAHRKAIETWATFARRQGLRAELPPIADARNVFETIVADWPEAPGRTPLLPWLPPTKPARAGR
jgi:hypothetical protein